MSWEDNADVGDIITLNEIDYTVIGQGRTLYYFIPFNVYMEQFDTITNVNMYAEREIIVSDGKIVG